MTDIYNEIFGNDDICRELWESRNSQKDIIAINSEWTIRNKLCDTDRSIELICSSKLGDFTTQLCLVTPDSFIFPRRGIPYNITQELKNKNYPVKYYSDEHDVTAGAFSMTSLLLALAKEDADFEVNTHKYEIILATDGSISCFKKGIDSSSSLSLFSSVSQLNQTSLDAEIISVFKFNEGGIGVHPTQVSEKFFNFLIKKRRLEIFTLGEI